MKSIIASLFTIYALASGNRRLLQTTQTPAAGASASTWKPVELPNGNAAAYQTTMECVLPNTARAGCAGRSTVLENAGQNFVLSCSAVGSCAATTFKFNYVNSMVERVEQISFSEQFAGYNAQIYIDSSQSARKQYIDKLECKADGACAGMSVKCFGGAAVNDVNCGMPNFCPNCNIYDCEWGPNGEELCGTGKACFYS